MLRRNESIHLVRLVHGDVWMEGVFVFIQWIICLFPLLATTAYTCYVGNLLSFDRFYYYSAI